MQPVLTAVADAGAEFIFFPIFPPETDHITRQAREAAGLEDTILMVCGSTVRSDAFIESVGQAGVGMYFVGASQPSNEASKKLSSEYEARYGEPPQALHLEFAYDAASIVLDALETVAAQHAQADGTLHIGRQALREAMYAISGFEGVTGTLTCSEFGDCGGAEFDILRLDDPEAGIKGLKSNVVYTFTSGQ
jgi:branched-chain amino acid transport system substrate-binding protein